MTTEEKIFSAAREVFHRKGFAAARMQEIADEAGINKAMLHYCFKNKDQLFEAVFLNAFGQLAPQINEIFNSEETLFVKIEKFTESYISFVMENPFLPQLIVQIQKEIELGIIKSIQPKQLVLDVLSMTVFPFAAQIMVRGMIGIPEDEFYQLMNERKTHIAKQIINSIKAG